MAPLFSAGKALGMTGAAEGVEEVGLLCQEDGVLPYLGGVVRPVTGKTADTAGAKGVIPPAAAGGVVLVAVETECSARCVPPEEIVLWRLMHGVTGSAERALLRRGVSGVPGAVALDAGVVTVAGGAETAGCALPYQRTAGSAMYGVT